ncbi:MAG: hypothetical protein DRP08_06520 [Candidatus Aenigmatarchaeota archaeon]|nr:MAG: hypothetical protein DRP08_06520 [Candidatus Aenigmarchaeota archaeon]
MSANSPDYLFALWVAEQEQATAGIPQRCPKCGAPQERRDWWGGYLTVYYECFMNERGEQGDCPNA